jgi:hypothetical protein
MYAQERLVKWHFTWQITKDVVTCRTCHASQFEVDKADPFAHLPGCRQRGEASDPWYELDRICQGFEMPKRG